MSQPPQIPSDENEPPKPPLNYMGPLPKYRYSDRIAPHRYLQLLAGFGVWVFAAGTTIGSGFQLQSSSAVVTIGCFMLAGIVFLSVWLRTRGWHLFEAGLLLGLAITCLVPIGIVAVICGSGGRG